MRMGRKSPKHSQSRVKVRYRKRTGKILSAKVKGGHRKASVHKGKLKSQRRTTRHVERRK